MRKEVGSILALIAVWRDTPRANQDVTAVWEGVAISVKSILKPLIPPFVLRARTRGQLEQVGKEYGVSVRWGDDFIEATRDDAVIRLGLGHQVYLQDCLSSFEYYFGAVKTISVAGRRVADFSLPRFHKVVGFDDFPILLPSIPEPYLTLEQYLKFARLQPGHIVFDLGVYSGLTSLVFSRAVGSEGAVFGFEPDSTNFSVSSENFETARHFGAPENIALIPKAVWSHENGLKFSVEGAMGSCAVSIVGVGRGNIVQVPTTTLSAFCKERRIERVDFIKMDIEGAEVEVLESSREWLKRVKPRLILEPHMVASEMTTNRCCSILEDIGYKTRIVEQPAASLPLIEACPV